MEIDSSSALGLTPPLEWAAQLYQMVQTQNQRMEGLEQLLQNQQNGGSTSTPESTSQENSNVRELMAVRESSDQKHRKLPELPEFSGKRTEFRPWLTQAKAKLSVDKDKDTEIVRF
ncbi:hypothetical protein CLAIMM_15220 [Cladophialophora immunda]|nr:hypothetical protein CLAIMM_15220 [Cladophialophora immunda]